MGCAEASSKLIYQARNSRKGILDKKLVYTESSYAVPARIVQCRMILKPGLIPIQDDPEIRGLPRKPGLCSSARFSVFVIQIRIHPAAIRQCFATKYSVADLELLVEVDRAHGRLSGPATRRILEREWQVFAQPAYARLAEISVGHLYNLRNSMGYRRRAAEFTATKPSPIAVGERRRPDPHGTPGYLRVDTVHQGDWEGVKGVYHINAVDTVRIPGDADQRSDLMAIAIPKSCRSRFRDDGDHCSDGKPITFRPSSEWRSASSESFY